MKPWLRKIRNDNCRSKAPFDAASKWDTQSFLITAISNSFRACPEELQRIKHLLAKLSGIGMANTLVTLAVEGNAFSLSPLPCLVRCYPTS